MRHSYTARPAPVLAGSGSRKNVYCEGLNNSENTKFHHEAQDRHIVDLDTLDACIDAGLVYERELFRKQLRLRKTILNLIAYRDSLQDLGKAVWREAK